MHDVFISYKSEEYSDALWVKNVLEENRISCWLAPGSIPLGSSYAEQISYAIKGCKVFVLILSQNSQNSIWVKKEIDMALNNGKTVVPFAIENCKLESAFDFYLCDVQRCNAYLDKARAMREMIDRINAVINCDKKHNIPAPETPVVSAEVSDRAPSVSPAPAASPALGKGGDTVKLGSYILSGNSSPIEWIVLTREDDRALLLSKNVLEAMPYNSERDEVTWEICSLRKWLKNSFYADAFTPSEQECILLAKNTNDNNPDYRTKGGNVTLDKVFLLSAKELKAYSKIICAYSAVGTEHAKESGLRVSESGKLWWWLRTPGFNNRSAVSCDTNGNADYNGEGVANNGIGVRPAVWVNIKVLQR